MMTGFHNVRFPLGVSFGATGGPEWRNEIVALTSGHEQRNARWAQSRRHFDAGTGVRSLADLEAVLAFFEARRGSLHAFRFRDPFDNRSGRIDALSQPVDQAVGTGDGETASFQLAKHYGDYRRVITKPVEGSARIAVDGVETEDFTLDSATGTITFGELSIPAQGVVVTAGFEFDTPVRFDTDRLTASITSFKAGEIPSIPIIEVKL
ncbi:MAG: phage distal tail protein, Rcc01695 family [Phyllobacterium sp.]